MTVLYLDCFAGASGDMVLGALIDAGLPLDTLREGLGRLPIAGYELGVDRVPRAGITASKLRVIEETASHPAGGAPTHGHHAHRPVGEITRLVEGSTLPDTVKARAVGLFRRLAAVEARIHGVDVDEVHLHEVGALDSIVDIVGAVYGFDWFGADRIVASPLNLGQGTVDCQHGTLPVPAPATAALVEGVPVYAEGARAELLTPTGALLVTGHATSYGPVPPMTIRAIGYGAGDRDLPGRPNVLRVLVGETDDAAATRAIERVVVIQTEIDDMNPQIFGVLMERLYAAGALDVYFAAVQMKKNRPGTLVTAVARADRREALHDVLFRETTTLGVRYQEVAREALERSQVEVETPIGPVRFKVARRGDAEVNAAPEFDDCLRLASAHGLTLKDVQALAMKAYLEHRGPKEG